MFSTVPVFFCLIGSAPPPPKGRQSGPPPPPPSGSFPPKSGSLPPPAGSLPPPSGSLPPPSGSLPPPSGNKTCLNFSANYTPCLNIDNSYHLELTKLITCSVYANVLRAEKVLP